MKEKIRNNKGITLIALIITIIVMLIIVGVILAVALQGGIFEKAKEAMDKTTEHARKEYKYATEIEGMTTEEMIKYYTSKEQERTLKIGERVYYNEGEKIYNNYSTIENANLDWAYFGTSDEGNILLISTNPIEKLIRNSGGANFGTYRTFVETLNTLCNNLYGDGTNRKGEKVAKYARSLTQLDLDKICNINDETRKKLNSRYGTAPYTYTTGKFLVYDENNEEYITVTADATNTVSPIHTYYSYDVAKYIDDEITLGLLIKGMNYETGEINSSKLGGQWCATRFVYCWEKYGVQYGVLDFSSPAGFWMSASEYSTGQGGSTGARVRPVVVLDENAKLELNARLGVWEIVI